ncbi:MAG: hypothetical protein AB2807_05550, partial [Candidatus Sedimenticola endophacoides]
LLLEKKRLAYLQLGHFFHWIKLCTYELNSGCFILSIRHGPCGPLLPMAVRIRERPQCIGLYPDQKACATLAAGRASPHPMTLPE